MVEKIKNLLKKKRFVFLLFFILLSVQLAYSFIFPASGYTGTGHHWLSLQDLISHNRSPLDTSDSALINKFAPFFANYTIVADGGVYLLLAKNFPQYYYQDRLFLSRPLYSFLVAAVAFLPSLFYDSYATIFASAILLNFILAFASTVLLYLLAEKLVSSRVALLSSFLYIFSICVHVGIIQPDTRLYGAFMVVAGLYLLFNYIKSPSPFKLAIFSLLGGMLLLGKMFCVVSIFAVLLAIYYKRYKEGILFSIIHLIPLGLWYFYVKKVLILDFYDPSVGNFGAVTWMLNVFSWPWHKTYQVVIDSIPNFVSATLYGFLVLPLLFAFIGFKKLELKNKEFFYFSFIFSFFVLFFITNFYFPYHAFCMFPVIYPLTILGIERIANFLKKYKSWYGTAFYIAAVILILIISNINIYKVFSY